MWVQFYGYSVSLCFSLGIRPPSSSPLHLLSLALPFAVIASLQAASASKTLRSLFTAKVSGVSSALKLFPSEPQTTVALLQSLQTLATSPSHVAAFLFEAGSYFPARHVGLALTSGLVGAEITTVRADDEDSDDGSGGDPEGATFAAARAGAAASGAGAGEDRPRSFASLMASRKAAQAYNRQLVSSYLKGFDFSDKSPVEALRALLVRTRMPREGRRIGTLLKLFADRYSECLKAAGPGKRLLYGFDLSNLEPEPSYLVVYAALVLNTDLRHTAIKTKMTKQDFATRNSRIPELQHIPKSFFEGLYDEVTINGLPVADNASTSPAFAAATGSRGMRETPHPAAVAALRGLTTAAAGGAGGISGAGFRSPLSIASASASSLSLSASLEAAASTVGAALSSAASRAAGAVSSVDWRTAVSSAEETVGGAWRRLTAGLGSAATPPVPAPALPSPSPSLGASERR